MWQLLILSIQRFGLDGTQTSLYKPACEISFPPLCPKIRKVLAAFLAVWLDVLSYFLLINLDKERHLHCACLKLRAFAIDDISFLLVDGLCKQINSMSTCRINYFRFLVNSVLPSSIYHFVWDSTLLAYHITMKSASIHVIYLSAANVSLLYSSSDWCCQST